MMNWFNTREPRERILLMVLAALLAAFIAWFALTRETGPDGVSELKAAQMDRELWLKAEPRLGGSSVSGDRSDFTRGALVDAASKRGVRLSRVQPQSDGGLSVWLDETPTSSVFNLIEDIVTTYSVRVETALMTTATNGGVNAQITLSPI